MNQIRIIQKTVQQILKAENDHHIKRIVDDLLDNLIERDILGFELKLFLRELSKELANQLNESVQQTVRCKLYYAADVTHKAQKMLNMKVYRFELN